MRDFWAANLRSTAGARRCEHLTYTDSLLPLSLSLSLPFPLQAIVTCSKNSYGRNKLEMTPSADVVGKRFSLTEWRRKPGVWQRRGSKFPSWRDM